MAKMSWKKEIARDITALGSIPFYLIVIVRAVVGPYWPFFYHLVIALLVLIILSVMVKDANQRIARGLVLAVFTSFFYGAQLYAVFAALLWAGMILSSRYLKVKNKEVVTGVILGVMSMIVSYSLTSLLLR